MPEVRDMRLALVEPRMDSEKIVRLAAPLADRGERVMIGVTPRLRLRSIRMLGIVRGRDALVVVQRDRALGDIEGEGSKRTFVQFPAAVFVLEKLVDEVLNGGPEVEGLRDRIGAVRRDLQQDLAGRLRNAGVAIPKSNVFDLAGSRRSHASRRRL